MKLTLIEELVFYNQLTSCFSSDSLLFCYIQKDLHLDVM